eukprot:6492624-Amphidinium_carterae.2
MLYQKWKEYYSKDIEKEGDSDWIPPSFGECAPISAIADRSEYWLCWQFVSPSSVNTLVESGDHMTGNKKADNTLKGALAGKRSSGGTSQAGAPASKKTKKGASCICELCHSTAEDVWAS